LFLLFCLSVLSAAVKIAVSSLASGIGCCGRSAPAQPVAGNVCTAAIAMLVCKVGNIYLKLPGPDLQVFFSPG
ncbi:MAG: hypothetical protein ABW019_16655, partial [Chitinophagaceae bacterium]